MSAIFKMERKNLFSSGLSFYMISLSIFFKSPKTMVFINLVGKVIGGKTKNEHKISIYP